MAATRQNGGVLLGAFRLVEPIGHGGMGEVWRADVVPPGGASEDEALPAAALKLLTAEGARSPSSRARFREEVFAVARLHHPAVVRVYDQGTVSGEAAERSKGRLLAGTPWLAMELASGGTLGAWRAPVPWAALVDVVRALLGALAHAHARGVVHRDLKPANVLLCGPRDLRPGPKISDFGLAWLAGRTDVDSADFAGTPAYMAPEQVLARPRDQGPWTDLYALGCLVWELVTGAPPFLRGSPTATARAHISDALPPLVPTGPTPPGLDAWLARLLEKDPGERFQLAADAAHALERVAAGAAVGGSMAGGEGPSPSAPTTVRWAQDDRTVPAVTRRENTRPAAVTVPEIAVGAPAAPRADDRPPLPATWASGSAEERVVADEAEARMRRLGVGLELWGLRTVPFVGRRAERDVLWGALRGVAERGRARALVLRGAAGYGRSRLAQFIAERAEELGGATALHVEHAAGAGERQGLAAAIRRRLRCDGLTRAGLTERVHATLVALGGAAPDEVAALGDALAPASDERTDVASETERHEAIARLLVRLAARRPLVLRIDDAQWGYEALGLVRHLLEGQEDRPAAVLALLTVDATSLRERPLEAERLAALLALPDAASLPVGPLPPRDHLALVRHLVGLDDALAARLAERTAGNPQFAVQVVGAQVQGGALVRGRSGFRLRSEHTTELPRDLRAAWAARLDAVIPAADETARVALELAAADGGSIVAGEWRLVCDGVADEVALQCVVERLVAARLAHTADEDVGAASGLADWAFVDATIAESARGAARAAGRLPGHHARWAAVLGPRYDDGELGLAARLARHLLGARRPEAALGPLLVAVQEASRRGAHALAADLLDRRERAQDQLELPAHDPARAENRLWRARVALDRGDLAEAASEAAAVTGGGPSAAGALVVLADVAVREGRLDEATARFMAARDAYGDLRDPAGVARTLEGLALAATYRGELNVAAGHLEEALRQARQAADPSIEASVLLRMAQNARIRDRTSDCLAHVNAARALYDRLDNATGIGRCLALQAEVARGRGALTAAEEGARRALSRIGAVGSVHSHLAPVEVGLVLVERGLHAEARRVLLRVLESLESGGQRGYAGVVHALLLPAVAAAGDWSAFTAHLDEARQRLQGLLDPDVANMAERAGALASAAGHPEEARAAYTLALEQWRALGRPARAARVEDALRS